MNEETKQDVNLENDEAQNETEQETKVTEEVSNEPDWKSEAMKYKAIAERLKGKLTNAPKEQKLQAPELDETIKRLSNLEILEEKRKFGYENNLSPEEVDKIFAHSKIKPTKEVLSDPFIQGGLEKLRQAKRVGENTPSSSRSGFAGSNKSFKEMTEDERRQAFEERAKNLK